MANAWGQQDSLMFRVVREYRGTSTDCEPSMLWILPSQCHDHCHNCSTKHIRGSQGMNLMTLQQRCQSKERHG